MKMEDNVTELLTGRFSTAALRTEGDCGRCGVAGASPRPVHYSCAAIAESHVPKKLCSF